MVSTGKDNEFAMKVAYHHRVAVEQALIELGCIEAREVPAQASSEPLPVQESSSGDVMSRDSGSRGASSSPQGSVAPKIRATKYYVGPTDNIDQRVYQVQFKHNFRYCTNKTGQNLTTGDFVILDCTHDQEDLGVVSNHYSLQQFEANRAKFGKSADEEENKIWEIVRIASLQEREHLPVKHEQEQRLLKICQHLATNVFRLPMNIYGVEFQFDGKKVNVFYTSDTRVDYKALVKEIYVYCKIHIWMRKTNRCVRFSPKEFATTALITGVPPFR